MLTIDELLEASDPVLITVTRARHIITVGHGLTDPEEFQSFMDSHGKGKDGKVCAASLYEWLGY